MKTRHLLYIVFFVLGMSLFLRFLVMTIPGVSVTSWFRSAGKNKAVGGARRSMHLIGWGIDIIPVNYKVEEAARKLFPFVLNEGDHIHVGWA